MLLKMFTVYDSKVKAYLPPMFLQSTGAAIRSFEAAVNHTDHDFNKYAPDFTLFEIGEFDDQTCKVQLFTTPIPLGLAVEYKKQTQPNPIPFIQPETQVHTTM